LSMGTVDRGLRVVSPSLHSFSRTQSAVAAVLAAAHELATTT
jgi:hypothetical protein